MSKSFLLFMVLVIPALGIGAQQRPDSSCSCNVGNGGCSVSQSCPDGFIASCSCSASGCSSQCLPGQSRPSGPNEMEIGEIIARNDAKALSLALSKAYGRIINFSFADGISQMPRPASISSSPVDWSLLEFLDKNGTLTINGHTLSFWKGMRHTLLNGGEFQVCSSRADAVLNEISFISGKSLSIVAGDAKAKLDAPVRGFGLPELLLNLSGAANVRIAEN